MKPGKYTDAEIKAGKALVKNQPKKSKASAPKKERKPPSEKQLAARKKFGDAAKARAAAKKAKN